MYVRTNLLLIVIDYRLVNTLVMIMLGKSIIYFR